MIYTHVLNRGGKGGVPDIYYLTWPRLRVRLCSSSPASLVIRAKIKSLQRDFMLTYKEKACVAGPFSHLANIWPEMTAQDVNEL